MEREGFKYHWWGKGDIDASFGIFFDGFSKILTATGIMTMVFGMPARIVIGKVVPGIQPVMKYLGAAYVLYLAWQTWRRLPPSDAVQEKKPTWLMGYFLQLVNVKIIIYGLTMFSAYILPYETKAPILFGFAVYLMFLGALGNLIWAFAGNMLKRFYSGHYKLMNGVMALLLVWCSLRIAGLL